MPSLRSAAVVAFALISILVFPWPVSVVFLFVASAFVPLSGIVLGVLADSLYGAPGASLFPPLVLLGALASGIGFFVHRFVKTRIMDA